MLRRSTAGPCASLACGATSAVMRRVASLLMSCSSSSDMPCPGSVPSEYQPDRAVCPQDQRTEACFTFYVEATHPWIACLLQ